jgi:hypothetical protein
LTDLADKVDDKMAKRLRDGFSDTVSLPNLGRVGAYEYLKEGSNADENYQDAVKNLEQGDS